MQYIRLDSQAFVECWLHKDWNSISSSIFEITPKLLFQLKDVNRIYAWIGLLLAISTWVNLVQWVCMLIFHSRISDPPNSSLLPAKIAIVRFGFFIHMKKDL